MKRRPMLILVVTVIAAGSRIVPAAGGEVQQRRKPSETGVILNQAADAIVGYMRTERPIEAGATKEMVLAGLNQVVDQYAGTQVSHLFFNVCYQRACYRSAVWQSYWDVADPETDVTGWPRRYWLIHKLGIDPFAVCIGRCREKGLSPWVSLRMNDTHYIDDANKTNRLWQDHPEYRTGPRGGYDYTRPEVRAHYLALIRELLERYDVDGVELDWMRFAHHFKPGAGEAGRKILTEFTRTVRKLTQQAAARRGHPVGIAARVPAVPEFALGLGMDGVAWAQQGLVDILIPCATWNPSDTDIPVEAWRQRIGAEKAGYSLAAGTDLWLRGSPGRPFMRTNMETMRGFTAAMLHRGADRIYLFNHFVPVDFKLRYGMPGGQHKSEPVYADLLSEAGSLSAIAGKPRRHVVTFHDPAPPGADNPKPLPAEIGESKSAAIRIYTGARPSGGSVVVRVGLDSLPDHQTARLSVQFNAAECRPLADLPKPKPPTPKPKSRSYEVWNAGDLAPRAVQFAAPLSAVKPGFNTIQMHVGQGGNQRVIWLEVLIAP